MNILIIILIIIIILLLLNYFYFNQKEYFKCYTDIDSLGFQTYYNPILTPSAVIHIPPISTNQVMPKSSNMIKNFYLF